MKCKICHNNTYPIKGLCLDRDGIREAIFCNECGVIWRMTQAGMSKWAVLETPYLLPKKDKIKDLAKQIIKECR